jgi:O-antigen/teichoic acid export membrane protein
MNNIRVTYSGLISLLLGTINIPLGFIFIIIITRTLDVTEYGTWGLISGMIVYATMFEPMISYWTTREIARNQESGKTAMVSGLLLSLMGVVIYFISAYILANKTDADQNIILLGSILIPLIFVNRILTSITLGWKPEGFSYGQIIFTVSQIPFGFIFVYFLNLGTTGVIYSVGIAYVVSIIFFLILNKGKIYGKIKKEFFIKWMRFSWIPLYPTLGGVILFLDVLIFSIITESVTGLAYWTASLIITTIIISSGLISRAVYTKLLQGHETKFLSDSLRQLFYFSILFTALVITFAKPVLFALNPEYAIAEFIVIILSIQVFFNTITVNLQSYILGMEKVDINKKATIKDYLKSKLFFIPTLTLIQSLAYITLLTIILLIMVDVVKFEIDLVMYWALIALVVQIPISIFTVILFSKNFTVKFNINTIFKYFISAIISFGITRVLINSFLEYENNIFEFIPQMGLFVIFSIMAYIGITLLIDSRTRLLAKAILSEIKP